MINYFDVSDLGDGMFCLKDLSTVQMYLVVGSQRAALLDTGTGIGDVAQAVRGLTGLPVDVYLTHGHVDHAGGIYAFDAVHVTEKDKDLMLEHAALEKREAFAAFVGHVTGQTPWTDADFIAPHPIAIKPLCPGQQIDLGGRSLTVVDLSGHTQGSVGYFDDATRTLFAGDGCNNSTFLFMHESATVTQYQHTLECLLAEWKPQLARMMICHDYNAVPLSCIDDALDCCERILAGTSDNEPFSFAFEPIDGQKCAWAVRGGPQRQDGKFGNIAFDTQKEN